jgi:hypothetical protein
MILMRVIFNNNTEQRAIFVKKSRKLKQQRRKDLSFAAEPQRNGAKQSGYYDLMLLRSVTFGWRLANGTAKQRIVASDATSY